MNTTKKANTSKTATTTVAAAFPAKTAAAPAAPAKDTLGVKRPARGFAAAAAADKPKRTVGDKLNAASRKPKDALAVLADKTIAAKAPAKARSAAAKRAEPAPAKKVATKAAKPATARKTPNVVTSKLGADMLPVHAVSNIGQLRTALEQFPHGAKFTTDRKFGSEIINVLNLRGRKIAEIKREVVG